MDVRWSATAGASRYLVLLDLSNGSARRFQVPGNRVSAGFAAVPRTAAVTVLVQGETASGQVGPPRGVRLRPTARLPNGVYPRTGRIPGLGPRPGRNHRHR